MLLFLTANMAAVTSRANQQYWSVGEITGSGDQVKYQRELLSTSLLQAFRLWGGSKKNWAALSERLKKATRQDGKKDMTLTANCTQINASRCTQFGENRKTKNPQ